ALSVFIAATLAALAILGILVTDTLIDGIGWLSWDFIRNLPSRIPARAGIWPALVGTVWIMVLTAAFTFPIGVGAAIYLEEFGGTGRIAKIIEINISNLAGVPSIVYGLLGLAIFVELSNLGPSVIAG